MKTHPFFLLILIVLLIGTFALPAAAQGPMPDYACRTAAAR